MGSCAVTAAGAAYCWGGGSAVPSALPGGVAFRSTSGAACGVSTRGDAFCWALTPVSAPALVAGGISFTQLAKGYGHVCGIDTDGAAWCWGRNAYGELGVSGKPESCNGLDCATTPVRVEGGHTFRSIVAGTFFTCALDTASRGYCWGTGSSGELGNGQLQDSRTPVAVSPPNTFASLRVGDRMTCALDQGGNTFCWGGRKTVPTRSQPESAVRTISLYADYQKCWIEMDGITYCKHIGFDGRVPGQ